VFLATAVIIAVVGCRDLLERQSVAIFTPSGNGNDASDIDIALPVASTPSRLTQIRTELEGFYWDSGRLMFVRQGIKHHVTACRPCGPQHTFCPGHSDVDIDVLPAATLIDASKYREGPPFSCDMTPNVFPNYSLWHRQPLDVLVDQSEPMRLNVLMTGVGRDLTGGPLSIMRFMNSVLKHTQFEVRWINVDGEGLTGAELKEHLKKYGSVNAFRDRAEFVHGALRAHRPPIRANPRDMFMATLYYTALIARATTASNRGLVNKNFVYFIQDFEPIFFRHDSDYVEALETYRYPHFAIYSTWFLQDYFKDNNLGMYGRMDVQRRGLTHTDVSFASEPAIKPWAALNATQMEDKNRERKVIVYARKHSDRNAFKLTIDALSLAICHGDFDEGNWAFIGVGGLVDERVPLGQHCGADVSMMIRQNIPESEYQRLVQSGDVGLSLMMSPHPSLPPFDFAAAGLITVTNSFETKTAAKLKRVSGNFVVAEPHLHSIASALGQAVKLSQNVQMRQRYATLNWETSWYGDRCYGRKLMRLLASWFMEPEPLWSIE
jgi:hypothetical protein